MSEQPQSSPPPGAPPLWGDAQGAPRSASPAPAPRGGADAPVPPSPGGELAPLSRRLLRFAAVLSVLLVAVVANHLLRSDEDPFNPVAVAAERAESCPGFRFSVYVVYSSPALPRPLAANGSGVYDVATRRTRMSLSVDLPGAGPLQFEQISDGGYNYERSNKFDALLPPGKEWVRTESGNEGDDPSVDFGESMQMLSSSGGVHVVGHESIDGKMTRRYRGEISLGELVEILREKGNDEAADAYDGLTGVAPTGFTVEAWVDRKNLPRRMRMVMPVPRDPGEPPFTMDIRMDLFDFGADPDIDVPDPDSVVDGPLDAGGGSSSATIS